MTTPDSPKGPESAVELTLAEKLRATVASLQSAADLAAYYGGANDTLADLEKVRAVAVSLVDEVDALECELKDKRSDLAFVRKQLATWPQFEEWEETASAVKTMLDRLREQLAAAVVIPKTAEAQLLDVFLEAQGGVGLAVAEAVLKRVRSWGVSSSEVEAPQHDEGRPSGSERLAPRSVKTFDCKQDCEAVAPECFCVGTQPHRLCCHEDAAQAARSEATPKTWRDIRGCEWEEDAAHDELRLIRTDPSHCREVNGPTFSRRYVQAHYGPLTEVPSPSLRKEGEDSV